MDDYAAFLHQSVVADLKIMSYRLLSRHLKVSANTAKRMLHDFHTTQNATSPGSVHATYLLTGWIKPTPPPTASSTAKNNDDEEGDAAMQSSPFDLLSSQPATTQEEPSSAPREEPLEKRVVVTPEHRLDDTKAGFVRLLSIAVYSLQPGPAPLKDLGVLAACASDTITQFAAEDGLVMGKTYGSIVNPNAKRRSGMKTPIPAPTPAPALAIGTSKVKTEPKSGTEKAKTKPKIGEKLGETSGDAPGLTSNTSSKKRPSAISAFKPATAKKDPFASFRTGTSSGTKKPAINPPGVVSGASTAPRKERTPSPPVEDKMETDSEDEADEGTSAPSEAETAAAAEAAQKRKQREDELVSMMEMDDSPPRAKKRTPSPPQEEVEVEQETEQVAVAADEGKNGSGRKKRRRKVPKQVMARDEDGYVVTKTVEVWEEYSADESEPVKKEKPAPVFVKKESEPAKGKGAKKGAAKGQGDLRNFFGKKT